MKKPDPAKPAELYIRWPKLRVWHVALFSPAVTVCGLPFDTGKVILGWATPATWVEAEGKCKSCERMKSAQTVRPRRPLGEV